MKLPRNSLFTTSKTKHVAALLASWERLLVMTQVPGNEPQLEELFSKIEDLDWFLLNKRELVRVKMLFCSTVQLARRSRAWPKRQSRLRDMCHYIHFRYFHQLPPAPANTVMVLEEAAINHQSNKEI